jgi:hypothetical protein
MTERVLLWGWASGPGSLLRRVAGGLDGREQRSLTAVVTIGR